MLKARYVGILHKIPAYLEFDGSNTSHRSLDSSMFTAVPVTETSGEKCCSILVSYRIQAAQSPGCLYFVS